MTSFRWILSLPYAFHAFKKTFTCVSSSALGIKVKWKLAEYFKKEEWPTLGANNNFNKLIQTQSRCLFVKKSTKGIEAEAEIKKQHDLFQLNSVTKLAKNSIDKLKVPPEQECSSALDVLKKLQDSPFHHQSIRLYLLDMIKLYKQLRFSPDFLTEMDTLKKSDEFEKFALALEKSLPMVTVNFLSLVFQAMHYYEIPYTSILMQKLHALILENINKFELTEVIKMYLIIKNKNDTLLEPLKSAFMAYMKHLTSDSLKLMGNLKSLTYYASNKEVPFSVREKILKKIQTLQFQLTDLEPIMLVWLSQPMCSEEFQFLDRTQFLNALKKNISSFQFKDLDIVLSNLSHGIYKKVIIYNRNMFDIIANCAKEYDLWSASTIMINLLRMGHVNYELADAIAEKVTKSNTNSWSLVKIKRILKIFGLIDYKNYLKKISPDNWLELEKVLKDFVKPENNFKSLEIPLHLFILELDTKEVVTKALNNFVKVLESNEKVSNTSVRHARLLYQCHCANYLSPPENVPEQILSDKTPLPSFICKEAKYKVFNGEEYVLENCKTPLGVFISFIVIFGPDLKPISLSSYKKSQCKDSDSVNNFIEIESIQKPPGSKVFAFIEYNKEFIKFRNIPLLKLEPRIITNIHKNLGYRIFHLFKNQRINDVDEFAKILSLIMTRELNYIASKASESSIAERTNIV